MPRLCRIAVALEIFPFCVFTVGAESTLDLVDCPACPVDFRGREQYSVLLVKVAGI